MSLRGKRQTVRVMALAGIVALLAIGCGSGQASEQDRVRQVADQFTAAFGAGDFKKACSLFDPAVFRGLPSRFGCEATYRGGSPYTRSFLTASPQRVVVTGSTATVGFSNHRIVRFKKVGGRWLVEDLGGASNDIGQ